MLTSVRNGDGRQHMADDKTLARVLARDGERVDGRQSEAFVWLRARFVKLAPRLRSQPGWRRVAEEMASDGIKGGKDRLLTGQAVRRIWPRVCRAVAAEEAARLNEKCLDMERKASAQKPRRREPERGANADRPPPVVTTPAPRPPVPSYPPPMPQPPTPHLLHAAGSRPHEELSEEEREAYAEAQILRLRRKLAEHSGHDPDEIR